ncbi:MAG: glutathione S-transferase family protein [Scytonema sp. PMC 1069.18]|nr:glutathione S-transferase family protein [Scytonema sp. PMC 1069.18]MEC4886702.1 glutathione S-transferase family protein [Scytonema sp. PMC 1070.18]
MALKVYDLAGAEDERRFSPFCWRVKMALRHKGLDVEEIPWRFTEKEAIAFSGQKLVPVLVDGDTTVVDSWEIARYLETTYPESPSLFGGETAEAEALFIKFWCEQNLNSLLFRIIILDIFNNLHEKDKAYFRETREKRFGMSLEEFARPTVEMLEHFNQTLTPMRLTLARQPFLGGSYHNFADYIVFSSFLWARAMSPTKLLSPDDPVFAWRDRLLDAFDGYGRKAFGYPV